MSTGYITLKRDIQDHWLWQEKPFDKKSAWIDLLLLARWKDGKEFHRGKLYERKRGEVNCSMLWLAERWGWHRDKVKRFLSLLVEDGMITLNTTTVDTTITIENYTKHQLAYEGDTTTDTTTDATTDTTTGTTTDTTHKKKDNKEKKEKKNNNPPISPLDEMVSELPVDLQESVKEFIEHRKQIKAPMNELSLKKMLNQLSKLSGGNTEMCKAILDQSIINGWKGIFELDVKREKIKNKTNPFFEALAEGRFRE